MRKKIWLLRAVVGIAAVLLALSVFLFSQMGNDKLIRPYVQEMLDEEVAVPIQITELRISWGDFHIGLALEDGSSIRSSGEYSLWSQSVDGVYEVAITELAHLEQLVGQRLNGPLSLSGTLVGGMDDLVIQGKSDLFDGQTQYDVRLLELQPHRILVTMQQGQFAQALHLANQPAYASGDIAIDAELTFENGSRFSGPVALSIDHGVLHNDVLQQEQGIELPENSAFALDANGTFQDDSLQSRAVLQSDLLDLNVSEMQLHLQSLQLASVFNAAILAIPLPAVEMQNPIHLTGNVNGTPDDLALEIESDIFDSASRFQAQLQNQAPQNIVYDIQNADLAQMQRFVRQPVYAEGRLMVGGTTDGIDLNRSTFHTETLFGVAVESIEHPSMALSAGFELNGTLQGTEENLLVNIASDILASETKLTLHLASLNPEKLGFRIGNLPAHLILSLLKQPEYLSGTIDAEGEFTHLDPENLQGQASIQAPHLLLNHEVVQREHNVSLSEDETITLSSSAEITEGLVRSRIDLSGSLIGFKTDETRVGIAAQSLETDYQIDIPELGKFAFLSGKELHGPLSASGEIHKTESLKATLDSELLGGEAHIRLDDEIVKTEVKAIEIPQLLAMLGEEKMTETGKLDLESTLTMEKNGSDPLVGLQGDINLYVSTIQVKGYDVDKLIEQFNKSKKVDLIDVGAFALAGPMGSILMKGLDVGGMAQGSGEDLSSVIYEIRADIDVDGGVAKATDVAFSSGRHRIAAKGSVDLPSREFKKFSVATLNAGGCSDFVQNIGGTLDAPKLSAIETAVNVVGSLVGSALVPIKAAVDLNCTPYYQGKVAHPVQAKQPAESNTSAESTDVNESRS